MPPHNNVILTIEDKIQVFEIFWPLTAGCCQMATSLFFIVQIYTIIVAGEAIHSGSMEEN